MTGLVQYAMFAGQWYISRFLPASCADTHSIRLLPHCPIQPKAGSAQQDDGQHAGRSGWLTAGITCLIACRRRRLRVCGDGGGELPGHPAGLSRQRPPGAQVDHRAQCRGHGLRAAAHGRRRCCQAKIVSAVDHLIACISCMVGYPGVCKTVGELANADSVDYRQWAIVDSCLGNTTTRALHVLIAF